MTLENAQNFRDKYTSEISNISASNDPRRIRTDNNEKLIISATVQAAGDVLNLSEDELNALITDRESLYKVLDAADVVRRTEQGIEHRGEFKQLGSLEERLLDPSMMGEDQDSYMNFGGWDTKANRTRDYGTERAERIKEGFMAPADMSDIEYEMNQAKTATDTTAVGDLISHDNNNIIASVGIGF